MSVLAAELFWHCLLPLTSCPKTQSIPFTVMWNREKQANPRFNWCYQQMFDIFSHASGVALRVGRAKSTSLVPTKISQQRSDGLPWNTWYTHSCLPQDQLFEIFTENSSETQNSNFSAWKTKTKTLKHSTEPRAAAVKCSCSIQWNL